MSEVEKFLDDWPNNGEMTPQERIKRLGEILDAYSDSSLMSIGYNRAAVMLFIQKDTARLPNRVQITIPYGGVFQGYDIKVVRRATGRPFRFEFFYGGEKYPDDEGGMVTSYATMKKVTLFIGSYLLEKAGMLLLMRETEVNL